MISIQRPTYQLSSWLFLRSLGLIYFIAFVSLGSQLNGLIGANGILPAREFLELASQKLGVERYWLLPTIFWLFSSDIFLNFACGVGILVSIALAIGFAEVSALVILWSLYLSFVAVCNEFLSFQWDSLLLETGFLAIFFAQLKWGPRRWRKIQPSKFVLWAFWFLLFKLMFLSGVVKLVSGDPTWRNLTALTFHYETQPLPTWIGWYAHQLPQGFHKMSAACVFLIELIVPFFIFTPNPVRLWTALALAGLQILILLTGNYCFFNLLTLALCLLLIDDDSWRRGLRHPQQEFNSIPEYLTSFEHEGRERGGKRWPKWVVVPVIAMVLSVSFVEILSAVQLPTRWFVPGVVLEKLFRPFRTVNRYGLFAVMTTSRPEIIVEGSEDGMTWKAYEFKWKPQRLKQGPQFVAPHQPRLDWQMWFAALSDYRSNLWFIRFLKRLLEGSPEVLSLLAKNPFPNHPPRDVRALVYEYRFTDFSERKLTGAWWQREEKGLYCPILSLESR